MLIKVLELLAEHGGLIAVILGAPFLAMGAAIVVLYKNWVKDKDKFLKLIGQREERLLKLIEQKVEADVKLATAIDNLKDVIQAQRATND